MPKATGSSRGCVEKREVSDEPGGRVIKGSQPSRKEVSPRRPKTSDVAVHKVQPQVGDGGRRDRLPSGLEGKKSDRQPQGLKRSEWVQGKGLVAAKDERGVSRPVAADSGPAALNEPLEEVCLALVAVLTSPSEDVGRVQFQGRQATATSMARDRAVKEKDGTTPAKAEEGKGKRGVTSSPTRPAATRGEPKKGLEGNGPAAQSLPEPTKVADQGAPLEDLAGTGKFDIPRWDFGPVGDGSIRASHSRLDQGTLPASNVRGADGISPEEPMMKSGAVPAAAGGIFDGTSIAVGQQTLALPAWATSKRKMLHVGRARVPLDWLDVFEVQFCTPDDFNRFVQGGVLQTFKVLLISRVSREAFSAETVQRLSDSQVSIVFLRDALHDWGFAPELGLETRPPGLDEEFSEVTLDGGKYRVSPTRGPVWWTGHPKTKEPFLFQKGRLTLMQTDLVNPLQMEQDLVRGISAKLGR